jgi:hypothetical protein
VAVLRRGPSDWTHIGRWDVSTGRYEPGAWLRGTLYPQRCDLSPDGRWFCYFALKYPATWKAGATYISISRLPWLTALAAWGTRGTWTHGAHFVEDPAVWGIGEPDEGDAGPCRQRFGLKITGADAFAVERRRGWAETADTPPRDPDDLWDERRGDRIRMEKAQPGSEGTVRLVVGGSYAAFRDGLNTYRALVAYELAAGDAVTQLDGVQWADWDAGGRLLVATRNGRLQIRELDGERSTVVAEHDLAVLTPDPSPPPAAAREW